MSSGVSSSPRNAEDVRWNKIYCIGYSRAPRWGGGEEASGLSAPPVPFAASVSGFGAGAAHSFPAGATANSNEERGRPFACSVFAFFLPTLEIMGE